jgi:hypothetical protein
MDRRIIAVALTLLICASTAWGRMNALVVGGGVGQTTSSCSTGDILSDSFNPTGGDATWSAGYLSAGCTSTLDQAAPSATGFGGQCYRTVVDTDAYQEAWHTWTDSSDRGTVYGRFYVRVDAEGLADGNVHRVFSYGANTTYPTSVIFAIKQEAGQLELTLSGLSLSGDFVNISTGTSYRVEFYVNNNGTTDSFEWKVDGVSQGTQSGDLFDVFRKINIGVHPDTATAVSLTVDIDKIDLSSTTWLGACE